MFSGWWPNLLVLPRQIDHHPGEVFEARLQGEDGLARDGVQEVSPVAQPEPEAEAESSDDEEPDGSVLDAVGFEPMRSRTL